MESTDSSTGLHHPNLPPGFRFHPTDEELVVHYLKKKAASAPLPVSIIADIDLYKFDPWELPAKATFGEQEWYFFSPRDRKYPNGARPNRAATSGYWKATGTDKPVLTSGGAQKVGVKKALVFYGGKPPKGIKTNWIMHEYRLVDNKTSSRPPGCDPTHKKGSLRLDDWVLCRIYKKNNPPRPLDQEREDSITDILASSIPPSIPAAAQHHHHQPKPPPMKPTNYASMLENDQSLFENIIVTDTINNNNNNIGSKPQLPLMVTTTTSNTLPHLKRTLPSLYWNNDDDDESEAAKRFQEDVSVVVKNDDHNNSSIATLLSQLPQTQQTVMGSLGEGVFRQQYQFTGLNWYS